MTEIFIEKCKFSFKHSIPTFENFLPQFSFFPINRWMLQLLQWLIVHDHKCSVFILSYLNHHFASSILEKRNLLVTEHTVLCYPYHHHHSPRQLTKQSLLSDFVFCTLGHMHLVVDVCWLHLGSAAQDLHHHKVGSLSLITLGCVMSSHIWWVLKELENILFTLTNW